MADPQAFNNLDELFRKTFDSLPDTPAASGWDVPSPQVWTEVQARLSPPKSGWTAQTILLIAGMATALLLGLYWATSRPHAETTLTAPETTTAATAANSPAPTAAAPANAMPETPATTAPNTQRTTPNTRPHTQSAPLQERTPAEDTPSPHNTPELSPRTPPQGSAPLPGTKPLSPNTTERRQAEAWRKAPWAQPLAPLPSVLELRSRRSKSLSDGVIE